MAIDFRADQIQARQIIGVGGLGDGNGAKIVFYPLSAQGLPPNNGLIDQEFFNTGSLNGRDIFLFVSGGIGERDTTERSISVFGGDLHISGNLSVDGILPAASTLQDAYDNGSTIQLATNKPVAITGSVNGPILDILHNNSNTLGLTIKRTSNNQKTDAIGYLSGATNFFAVEEIAWEIGVNGPSSSQFCSRGDGGEYSLAYTFVNKQAHGMTLSADQNNLILQTQANNEILLRSDLGVNPFRFRVSSSNNLSPFTCLGPIRASGSLTVASGITGALNVLPDGSPFIVSSDETINITTGSNGQIDLVTQIFPTRLFLAGYKVTTADSTNPQVAGAAYFAPLEHKENTCFMRTIINTDNILNNANVQLYNITDEVFVDIGGPGDTELTVGDVEPTLAVSVNLFGATGFSASPAIYEVRIFGSGSSNITTHFSTELVCE